MQVSQNVPCNTIIGNAGARGSKRVRALDEQDQIQPPRVTRQKAKELIRSEEGVHDTTTTMQEDALTIANCLNQTDHDTEMCNEGKKTILLSPRIWFTHLHIKMICTDYVTMSLISRSIKLHCSSME
jgi:hypothetical protein